MARERIRLLLRGQKTSSMNSMSKSSPMIRMPVSLKM